MVCGGGGGCHSSGVVAVISASDHKHPQSSYLGSGGFACKQPQAIGIVCSSFLAVVGYGPIL